MVVVKQIIQPANLTMTNNEMRLNSARVIKFTAPLHLDITTVEEDQYAIRKRSNSNQLNSVCNDAWSGVTDFCQAIDDIIVIEKDSELFLGKSVLEIGFTTGIPSTLAMDAGASEITLHSWDQQSMATYIKGTIRRNGIPKNLAKFSTGELDIALASLNGKKFDIILAPELINTDEKNYATIVQVLSAALSDYGIILLSGRSFYDDVTGSVQGFLDYCKTEGTFDGFVRWTSQKPEINPHKLVQLTSSFR